MQGSTAYVRHADNITYSSNASFSGLFFTVTGLLTGLLSRIRLFIQPFVNMRGFLVPLLPHTFQSLENFLFCFYLFVKPNFKYCNCNLTSLKEILKMNKTIKLTTLLPYQNCFILLFSFLFVRIYVISTKLQSYCACN